MKQNLLVTLADKNYINQAKHFFTRAYFYSGWRGDYMLLAYNMLDEDLSWFEQKGILIKHCPALVESMPDRWPPTVLAKFYLFTEEFKKWDKIIYADADFVINAALDQLLETNNFSAISLNYFGSTPLLAYFDYKNINFDKNLFLKIKREFNLNKAGFSGGLFCLPTVLVKNGDFEYLKKLIPVLQFCKFGEELALNLLFYDRWKKISFLYCISPEGILNKCHLKQEDVQGVAFHFEGRFSPWQSQHYWYKNWQETLILADQINLTVRPKAKKVWSNEEILSYQNFLKQKYFYSIVWFKDLLKRFYRRSWRWFRLWLFEK